MHSSITLAVASFVLSALAMPTLEGRATSYPQPVTFIHPIMKSSSQLSHAPSTLKSDEKAFLDKFQPLANKLTSGQKIANGWCYAEYPCQSISGPAAVEIRGSDGNILPAITVSELTDLLDLVQRSKTTDFKPSVFNKISSASLATSKVELTIYALPSNVDSSVIAGAVFDLYKIHTDDTATNAARGVQVENKFTLCLTPVGADSNAAQNFCVGRELNGAMPPASEAPPAPKQKRSGDLGIGCAPLAVVPIIGWLAAAFCGTF